MILFVILALVNIIPLFIFKRNARYWMISVPLSILMLAGFIGWKIDRSRQTRQLELRYSESSGNKSTGDSKFGAELSALNAASAVSNRKILNELFFQTFLMWILQMIGLRRTRLRYYFWLAWITGILFFAALVIEAIMAINPSGSIGQ